MKALAVCGFGVGSSMVLKMSIEKAAKELGLDIEVENTDISSAKAEFADVYFTGEDFAKELINAGKENVYVINKYMDKEEVKAQLNNFMKGV